MPAGSLVTTPVPSPVGSTSSQAVSKVAATSVSSSMTTWQEPVPEQAPSQPRNTESSPDVAVNVTSVPAGYASQQSKVLVSHVIPAGSLVTVPSPSPSRVTPSTRASKST